MARPLFVDANGFLPVSLPISILFVIIYLAFHLTAYVLTAVLGLELEKWTSPAN
jgi:hypothetical protein